MGIFRLILALLVACAHMSQTTRTAWWTASAAVFAVKAFFVMSGFYMALVLDVRYRDKPVGHFYAARALRLLPAYWCVSLATLVAALALVGKGGSFYSLLDPVLAWRRSNPSGWSAPVLIYVLVSLTTLVGSDTWMWLGFNATAGNWSIAPTYSPGATSALVFSFVPQAWTIGIEILFYLLAPLLVARGLSFLILLSLGSLAFRGVLGFYGFAGDPWSRALLPSELIYFIGGIVAYRLYQVCQKRRVPVLVSWAAFVLVLGVELSMAPYVVTNGNPTFVATVPFVLLVVAIPFVFTLTRETSVDTQNRPLIDS